jgi:hypothetical protein
MTNNDIKSSILAKCQWLMPVILAIREAEIRRIVVGSKLGLASLKKPITKKGWWSDSRCRS